VSTAGPSRQLSLRTYLLLLIAGSMLPFLLVSGVLLLRVLQDSRAGIERTLLDSARQQASILDAELDATIRTLEALTFSTALTTDPADAFERELVNVIRTQPGWLSVRLLDRDGRVLLDTARPGGGPFGIAVEPASVESTVSRGEPTISPLRRGPGDQLAFAVRVPVLKDGTPRYALTAVVKPEAIGDLVSSVAPAADEWTRVVVDSGGTIVARTRSPERFVGQPATASFMERTSAVRDGFYQDTSLEGAAVYVAFSHSPRTGWVSGVVVPVSVMDGPIRRSMSMLLLLGLSLLMAGGAAANWMARRLSFEINSAAQAAERLSQGEAVPASDSVVSDISRLRQSLERSGALLRQRLEERDRNVAHAEAARGEAEKANLAKDQFLAMLGHELRNPLSPIVTALGLLKARGTAWTKEHAVIERQVQHMSRLVGDLLDVSRIARGSLEIRRELVHLDEVIAQAVEMAAPLFEKHRHQLKVDVPHGLVVHGDAIRLSQVFVNLLSNAAEYTPNGGRIAVRARREGADIITEVQDNGRGIRPELAPRIFDLFVQGPRTIDRREGGLGLGLSIARSLVSIHDGRITAHSPGEGGGSTFTVCLPAAGPEEVVSTPGSAGERAVSGRRVLVVDDNEDALDMLRSLLTMSGHTVATAADGPSALQVLKTFEADVALLDIGLPVMDGHELARRILADADQPPPLLVAVTGYGQADDIERSRAAGFAHHVVKPVDPTVLLDLLDRQVPTPAE
jgi:signal transduction histidine kinase/ActR/RegA family two-component response regulator